MNSNPTNPNAKLSDEEFVKSIHSDAHERTEGGRVGIFIGKSQPINCGRYIGAGTMAREAWSNAKTNVEAARLRAEEGIGEATIDRSSCGYSIPKGSHHPASFWQGFAMALGSVNRYFDNPTIVRSVMDGYGVTVKLLKEAAVEDYDLGEIRKCMK